MSDRTVPRDDLLRIRRDLAALAGRSRSNGAAEDALPEPDLVCMADVAAQRVQWEWEPWLPRRELTLLDGDPGMAKSTLSLDLIARVTRGWPMPPASIGTIVREPETVVILSAEDDPAAVIRPPLDAAGADVDK